MSSNNYAGDESFNDESAVIDASSSYPSTPLNIYHELFHPYPFDMIRAMSNLERVKLGFDSTTLCYGEVNANSYVELITSLETYGIVFNKNGYFVDIGSGIGNVVIATALLNQFTSCIGVEILPCLHDLSLKILHEFNHLKRMMNDEPDSSSEVLPIQFILGDATFLDWSDNVQLVFVNATCFDKCMMGRIYSTAKKLKEGAVIITLTFRLLDEEGLFNQLTTKYLSVNWGYVTAYVYRKNEIISSSIIIDTRSQLNSILNYVDTIK
eukprot:gene5703-7871_t